MWRFDLTARAAQFVKLLGDAGAAKPITTRPDVTMCAVPVQTEVTSTVNSTAGVRVLFGTGRLLDVPDTTNTAMQSLFCSRMAAAPSPISVVPPWSADPERARFGQQCQHLPDHQQPGRSDPEGWLVLQLGLNAGERMNLDPQIVSGVVNVVTNLPSSSSACSVGGTSNLYQVDVCNGQAMAPSGGLTLSNTSAAVGFIIVRLPNGQLKMVTTLADGSNDHPCRNRSRRPRRAGAG
jgi:type IV pilus assembly protein PilY1